METAIPSPSSSVPELFTLINFPLPRFSYRELVILSSPWQLTRYRSQSPSLSKSSHAPPDPFILIKCTFANSSMVRSRLFDFQNSLSSSKTRLSPSFVAAPTTEGPISHQRGLGA